MTDETNEAPVDAGAENGGQAPAGAAPAETKDNAAEPAKAPAAGGQAPGAPGPSEKPAGKPDGKTAAPAPARTKSLLEEAEDGEAPSGGEPAAQDDAAKKRADEFRGGIRALDLGDGVRFDDATLDAFTPALMDLAGGDPKKAEPIVRAYVGYVQKMERAQQEYAEAFANELVAQCQKRWGSDVRKVAKMANEGGRAVFGDAIWNEMKGIKQFANNPDILERLAMFGKRVAEDGGAVHPAGTEPEDTRDVLSRMYAGIK